MRAARLSVVGIAFLCVGCASSSERAARQVVEDQAKCDQVAKGDQGRLRDCLDRIGTYRLSNQADESNFEYWVRRARE